MATDVHVLALLQSLGPVAIQIVGYVVDEVVLSIGQRTIAGSAGETSRVPMTVESEKTCIHQGLHAASTFRIVLCGEALDAIGMIVSRLNNVNWKDGMETCLEGLLDGFLAAGTGEMVGVPQTVQCDNGFISD